jgi:preprotein translocase subunit SecE
MKKISEAIQGVRSFFGDVGTEMRKTTWPAKDELIESTVVVIVSVCMLSVFIGVCDRILVILLRLFIGSG